MLGGQVVVVSLLVGEVEVLPLLLRGGIGLPGAADLRQVLNAEDTVVQLLGLAQVADLGQCERLQKPRLNCEEHGPRDLRGYVIHQGGQGQGLIIELSVHKLLAGIT